MVYQVWQKTVIKEAFFSLYGRLPELAPINNATFADCIGGEIAEDASLRLTEGEFTPENTGCDMARYFMSR
jgi:hypothetical protein